MFLVVIAWLYVVLMMAVAEATNTTGTVLGAIVTFLLYGLAPVSLVVYLMSAPARRRAIQRREAAEIAAAREASAQSERTEHAEQAGSLAPDAGRESPADPIAPVREKN
ncbi:MAG: hypothetical protein KKC85_13455 [Gammaproteobacteria bacterium]|nr:hypothetical protein [Gammaproteobacteria bacterium]MBU1441893.1 hypothetical protein [Gammaproteobacteria bacterium]MBU2287431.1 hypothetical protein [Gammaproteobacteria bacterium]